MFKNRTTAGKKLAEKVAQEPLQEVVVLALPRGGLPLAVEVAALIGAPLDLVLIRKIGHPANPEFAIGAVAENDEPLLDPLYTRQVGATWLKQKVADLHEENNRRRLNYLANREQIDLKDKTVIIVDDGVATGFTLLAAIESIRKRHPQKVIAAVPVVPRDTAQKIVNKADQLIALETPDYFIGAVGAYYTEFPQVSDEEVIAYLNQFAEDRG